MQQKLIKVKYYRYDRGEREFSHSSEELWNYDKDIFCPSCGKKDVWVSDGPGDYYDGPEHICTACECSFHLNGPGSLDETSKQRLEQLRN